MDQYPSKFLGLAVAICLCCPFSGTFMIIEPCGAVHWPSNITCSSIIPGPVQWEVDPGNTQFEEHLMYDNSSVLAFPVPPRGALRLTCRSSIIEQKSFIVKGCSVVFIDLKIEPCGSVAWPSSIKCSSRTFTNARWEVSPDYLPYTQHPMRGNSWELTFPVMPHGPVTVGCYAPLSIHRLGDHNEHCVIVFTASNNTSGSMTSSAQYKFLRGEEVAGLIVGLIAAVVVAGLTVFFVRRQRKKRPAVEATSVYSCSKQELLSQDGLSSNGDV